jgi:hypothetical protein
MSPIPILRLLKICDLSPAERKKLRATLQKRKQDLETAIQALSPGAAKKRKRKKR